MTYKQEIMLLTKTLNQCISKLLIKTLIKVTNKNPHCYFEQVNVRLESK